MNNRLKNFIFEFNKLCRKDNRIESWAVYANEFMRIRIDINFIDYNNKIYDYHIEESMDYLIHMDNNELKRYAIYIFDNLQRSFEIKEIIGVDNE